jgi:protein disulfide-isomerase
MLQQAQSEHKLVMLDFCGSDWCPDCILFDRQVLANQQFADYAGQRLMIVRVDFPRQSPQPDDLRQANAALHDFFKITVIPTFVVLNGSGNEIGRLTGYRSGGPDDFIKALQAVTHQ